MCNFSKSDDQCKRNNKLCFSIIKTISVILYRQVETIYSNKNNMQTYTSVLNNVLKNIKITLKVLLIFYPTIMQYLIDKTPLIENKKINTVIKQTKKK